MVRPESLETPERGMELEDRGPVAAQAREPGESEDAGADELRALRDRIQKARHVTPGPQGLHCRDCFARGRDAALKVIEGK